MRTLLFFLLGVGFTIFTLIIHNSFENLYFKPVQVSEQPVALTSSLVPISSIKMTEEANNQYKNRVMHHCKTLNRELSKKVEELQISGRTPMFGHWWQNNWEPRYWLINTSICGVLIIWFKHIIMLVGAALWNKGSGNQMQMRICKCRVTVVFRS